VPNRVGQNNLRSLGQILHHFENQIMGDKAQEESNSNDTCSRHYPLPTLPNALHGKISSFKHFFIHWPAAREV
jgi:hypothetical protein